MKSLNEEEIRSMLVEVCGDGSAGDRGIDLIETGLLDSLAIIELFTRLEELGYDIHPTRVDRSRLRTAEGIASLLREYAKE